MVLFNIFAAGRRRETIPIFPLGTVLFPGSVLPLRIFEVRYIDMARDCLRNGAAFGVCLIREGEEAGAPAVPEPIGCTARTGEFAAEELWIIQVRGEGLGSIRIASRELNNAVLIVGPIDPVT